MSNFLQFDSSAGEVFVESPGHQRNAPVDKCELQIAAVQAVNGYLPFDYVAGTEVTGVYMQKVILKEWNIPGSPPCVDSYHSAELTTRLHRRFDDSGAPYFIDLNTSCGHAYTSILNAGGTYDTSYNPAIYLQDQNDDGSPNPGNWGLNTSQNCIVWFTSPFNDSRTQTHVGYDVEPSSLRCGEGFATRVGAGSFTSATVRLTITEGVDTSAPGFDSGDPDTWTWVVTSRYTETLSDWYPKEEAGPPDGNSWKEVAKDLLQRRTFARWTFIDINDDTQKTFGCELSDTQRMTLYWKRGYINEVGAREGEIPGTTPSWIIVTQLELVDWSGGSPTDPGSDATFVSGSTGSPPAGIWCKKSRVSDTVCRVFIEQTSDGGSSFTHLDPVCVTSGPLSGFQDFIPAMETFGYEVSEDPLDPDVDLSACCPP